MYLADPYLITSLDQLSEQYDPPAERSLLKQSDQLDAHSRAFIAAAPFMLLATCGPSGVDCSPRGDQPGFVQVADDKTLLIPDRRGNNRIDSLKNIVANAAVGLLFMVPGVHETFRINGRARLSVDPALLRQFAIGDKLPKVVIVVTVDEVFVQCSRALVRSDLWNPQRHIARSELPSMGTILETRTGGKVCAADYDAQLNQTVAQTLY